jgi:tetratricopeptide (TPR) repeat protein
MLIAVLGFIAYSNTFNVPFVLDDRQNIVENQTIRNLEHFIKPSNAESFTGFVHYPKLKSRFIGYLSFALNYRLHGLNVRGYHMTNLAIHLLNGVLYYVFVVLTFKAPLIEGSPLRKRAGLIALFSALLFVSHPVQTQAVTYIVQRFSSLAAMFYLLSLLLYAKWRLKAEHQSSRALVLKVPLYFASLLSAVFAMETKQIAFTLPVVIVLYEFTFFRGSLKRRMLYLIPLLLTMLIIPLSHMDLGKPIGEVISVMSKTQTAQEISQPEYLLTEFRVIVTYLRLLVLPINQNLDYDYPVYSSFFEPPVFLSFLFLLSLFGLGVYLFHRSRITDNALRIASFGVFWFFGTLSVESSFIPLHVIFEHRVYLPSIGLLAAIVVLLFSICEAVKAWRFSPRKALIPLLLLTVILMASAAYTRNSVWQSETSLWEDVVKKSPQKARGHLNLGSTYFVTGLIDKAMKHYKTALLLEPGNAVAYNNLGLAYKSKGQTGKALEQYKLALKFRPDFEDAHMKIAALYISIDRTDKAIEHYRKVLIIKPYDADAHFNLSGIYFRKGLINAAVEHMQEVIRLRPDYANAHNNMALLCGVRGQTDKAIEHLLVALRLKPNYAEVHLNLGIIYLEKGLIEKARREFEAALKINPDYRKARKYLEKIRY